LVIPIEKFKGAAFFNQDLCTWSTRLPSNVVFQQTFAGTACISTSDPTSVTAGPYCAICPAISPALSPQPSESPQPSPSPTVSPAPTIAPLSSFANTGELRTAVVAAELAGANCAATVYQTYGPMNAWDVSRITSLDSVFSGIQGPSFCTTAGLNLNNWDVSKVTSMNGMSQAPITSHISVLTIVPNIEFESISALFYNSYAGFQPVINEWDTSSVTRMGIMVSHEFTVFLCGVNLPLTPPA
jgi:hypothetical protein